MFHTPTTLQDVNVNTYFDTFEQPITGVDGVKIDSKWFTNPSLRISKEYTDYLEDLAYYAEDRPFEEVLQSKGLTNATTKANILERMVNGNRSYDAPVSSNVVKRPGANTALGRWYSKNHPNEYPYAIGPTQHFDWNVLKNPYMAIPTRDRLPF